MAIGTDDSIDKFGTQDTVDSSSSAVADAAYSVTGDTSDWTNDDDVDSASAVLGWQHAAGVVDAGGHVNLYAQLKNIDSTNDETDVSANNPKHRVGSFPVAITATATLDYVATDISLANTVTSQVYKFWIENKTGVSIDAGWTLKITPKTQGPSA